MFSYLSSASLTRDFALSRVFLLTCFLFLCFSIWIAFVFVCFCSRRPLTFVFVLEARATLENICVIGYAVIF